MTDFLSNFFLTQSPDSAVEASWFSQFEPMVLHTEGTMKSRRRRLKSRKTIYLGRPGFLERTTSSTPAASHAAMIRTASFRCLELLFCLTTCVSCVSVQLGPKKPEPASGITAKEPGAPFKELSAKGADKAWKNPDTGSTISYLSTCHDPADPTLQNIREDLLSGLGQVKIISDQNIVFDERSALRTLVESNIDGIRTNVEFVIAKKNDCSYTITLVSIPKWYSRDEPLFNGFLKGFQAP